MLLAITPSGGIAQSTGAPVAAGSTAVAWKMDPGGGIVSMGSVTIYNVSTAEAVPGSVLATLSLSPNNRYYASTWSGQASPASVLVPAAFQQGFANPGSPPGF